MPSNHARGQRLCELVLEMLLFLFCFISIFCGFFCRCCFLLTWQRTLCVARMIFAIVEQQKVERRASGKWHRKSSITLGWENCGLYCFHVWRRHCIWTVWLTSEMRLALMMKYMCGVRAHKSAHQMPKKRWEGGAVKRLFVGSECVMALQIR